MPPAGGIRVGRASGANPRFVTLTLERGGLSLQWDESGCSNGPPRPPFQYREGRGDCCKKARLLQNPIYPPSLPWVELEGREGSGWPEEGV